MKCHCHLFIDFIFLFLFPPSFREHYFASAAWVSQTEVSVVWMNRAQNLSVVTLCKSPMWYCQEVSFVPQEREKIAKM
jgi:Dipeptidyl peptidase IV (DPP IV) N-terminal region